MEAVFPGMFLGGGGDTWSNKTTIEAVMESGRLEILPELEYVLLGLWIIRKSPLRGVQDILAPPGIFTNKGGEGVFIKSGGHKKTDAL